MADAIRCTHECEFKKHDMATLADVALVAEGLLGTAFLECAADLSGILCPTHAIEVFNYLNRQRVSNPWADGVAIGTLAVLNLND